MVSVKFKTAAFLATVALLSGGVVAACGSDEGRRPADERTGQRFPQPGGPDRRADEAAERARRQQEAAERAATDEARFRAEASAACLEARRGGALPPPRGPAELRRYAPAARALVERTLAGLASVRPAAGQRSRLEGLRSASARLVELYERAAIVGRRDERALKGLLTSLRQAEQGARAAAQAAELPACAPGT